MSVATPAGNALAPKPARGLGMLQTPERVEMILDAAEKSLTARNSTVTEYLKEKGYTSP